MSMWGIQQVQSLRNMWAANQSAGEIADALGTTRNAVIGKLNRLGLGCDRDEWQRRVTVAMRRKFADPEFRKRQAEAVRAGQRRRWASVRAAQ